MKKVLSIVLPIVILIGGLLGGGYYVYENTINTNTIYEGISIDEYSVSGKTFDEAMEYIKEQKDIDITNKAIHFSYNDYIYAANLQDFGYSYNHKGAVEEAYALGRGGNLFERFNKIQDMKKNNIVVPLEPQYDRDLVLEMVDHIADDIYQESHDAVVDFNNGDIKISAEKEGISLKKGELINIIVNNIDELKDIELPVEIIKPKLTKQYLSSINGIIGEFSTSFKGSSYGRIQNIKVSAKSMSNLLILPGEQVSYNETLGAVKSSNGYMEAPVILNGELTPGMGGGVCQTSTTLYNALLLADVNIVERHPHSIAARYVPKGTDGAVASGFLDLKFKNNFDFPIYTYSKIVGDRLYFYIYGDTKAKDYSVKIEPELIQTIPYKVTEILDQNAEPGSRTLVQEGRTGYKVKTYKSIIKDGKVVERTQISSDYYREKNFIYKIGPAVVEPIKPTEQTEEVLNPVEKPIEKPIESLDPIDEDIEVIDLN